MKTEKLHIKNFAGLNEIDIELAQINILIGPQASGKSICAKLCFFFKEIFQELPLDVNSETPLAQMKKSNEDTFLKYFPASAWGNGPFEIRYSCGELWVAVKRTMRNPGTVTTSYSSYFKSLVSEGIETARAARAKRITEPRKEANELHSEEDTVQEIVNQKLDDVATTLTNWNTFIPAGRSFFATFRRSMFSMIARDAVLDPFMVNFGRSYQRLSQAPDDMRKVAPSKTTVERYVSRLIGGSYLSVKEDEFIRMTDGRRIPLEYASSGQQEALPLAITLAGIARTYESSWCTLVIEEPEAHLYPSAQRDIVHLIALVAGIESGVYQSQYLITTHSPYILSALNNLMYGGKISKENPEKKSQVSTLLGGIAVEPLSVHAYALGGGTARSIISLETGLIDADVLDSVSGELAKEFEELADMEFES